MNEEIKKNITLFMVTLFLLLIMVTFVWYFIIDPVEQTNTDCSEPLGLNYSFWSGWEGDSYDRKAINKTHYACCKQLRYVDSEGFYHERGDCVVIIKDT